ncbi:uncharacterized protein B0I36DRAFT_368409 [Microdochium trichocladiopsis]|uniref:Uncharacterized protein n=1 Tax=Microdochium trichocladiopsis TaxID=1682393 RepID=A0A9P8XUZ3_9PEZI|nr:uncharacterized protein B0I36DRAFT_368409 [Microdochium trichocladiopsis]KAH7018386.1 hypothetical protein B0I36DRAFT_368409 [Microdochium trichocladiopsis]
MRLTTSIASVLAAAFTLAAALPTRQDIDTKRSPSVETAGASGADDDDAIAYAWFAEDDQDTPASTAPGQRARAVEASGASGVDDDDAIAYAWFADDEDSGAVKRGDNVARGAVVEGAGASGVDDDDAIAYAWFAEDEE